MTTTADSAVHRFARHALANRFDDLSGDAVGHARVFILDTPGVVGSAAGGADGASESWIRKETPMGRTLCDKAGLGRHLFNERRYDERGVPRPDVVLDRPPFDRARILVVGPRLGSGREQARRTALAAGNGR